MSIIDTLQDGECLAYLTKEGWAYAGDRFSRMEGGYMVTKMSFACGAIRFERRDPKGWAVIRGTEVFPLVPSVIVSQPQNPQDFTPQPGAIAGKIHHE